MERQRGPAEAPNHGTPVTPRPAASVVLLRRGGKHAQRALEVLLLKRTEKAAFMPGAWVFPGGSVDPADGEGPDGFRACAVRELREEAGIELPRRRGARPLLPLGHPGDRLAPLRRLVLPRPRPRPHAAPRRRGRDRRRALVRARRGARRRRGGRADPPLPDPHPARLAGRPRDLRRRARRLPRPLDRADPARTGRRGRRAAPRPPRPAGLDPPHRTARDGLGSAQEGTTGEGSIAGASGNGASPACQGPGG